MRMLITVVLVSLLLIGCRTTANTDTIKSKIIEGTTTQAEVKAFMGEPGVMSRTSAGDEVWTYESQSRKASFVLVVEFDSNGVVKSYTYRSCRF